MIYQLRVEQLSMVIGGVAIVTAEQGEAIEQEKPIVDRAKVIGFL